jgi:hypothetical protein
MLERETELTFCSYGAYGGQAGAKEKKEKQKEKEWQAHSALSPLFQLVPGIGVEPIHSCERQILSLRFFFCQTLKPLLVAGFKKELCKNKDLFSSNCVLFCVLQILHILL